MDGDRICAACGHVGPPTEDSTCSKCGSEDVFPYGTDEEKAEHEAICEEDVERRRREQDRFDY